MDVYMVALCIACIAFYLLGFLVGTRAKINREDKEVDQ